MIKPPIEFHANSADVAWIFCKRGENVQVHARDSIPPEQKVDHIWPRFIEKSAYDNMSLNYEGALSDINEYEGQIEELKCEIDTLKEALMFYADPSTWILTEGHELRTIGTEDMEIADEPTPWGAKGTFMAGKTARIALGLSQTNLPKESE